MSGRLWRLDFESNRPLALIWQALIAIVFACSGGGTYCFAPSARARCRSLRTTNPFGLSLSKPGRAHRLADGQRVVVEAEAGSRPACE